MTKKVLPLVLTLVLVGAVLLLTPGLLALLLEGRRTPPDMLGQSTLTAEELRISAKETDASYVDSTARYVRLEGDRISFNGYGAEVTEDGRCLTITRAGTYVLSGTLADGRILVDAADEEIHLVLNGVTLSCSNSAPVYILAAKRTRISVTPDTVNEIADTPGTLADPVSGDPSAAIYSNDDLSLCGTGSLKVVGRYREAIHSKNRLVLSDLTLQAEAPEDVLVGHDALLSQNVRLTVSGGGDCLKSNNPEPGLGYIYIASGRYDLTAKGDAVQAEARLLIKDGDFHISAGGGYTATPDPLRSTKGIKSGAENVLLGGTYDIDTADDALHADGLLSVEGGRFTIYTASRALKGREIALRGGDLRTVASYRGIVGERVHLSDGTFSFTAQDDGLHVRAANTAEDDGFSLYPTTPDPNVRIELSVSGGLLSVEAEGDAVDVMGDLFMSDGFLLLCAPTYKGGDPLELDGTFYMSGGTVVTTGRASFLPSLPEGEGYVLDAAFSGLRSAGESISLCRADGSLLFSVTPAEDYYNFAVYSCELAQGSTYSLLVGGTPSGEEHYGVLREGSLSGATPLSSFSLTGRMTKLISRSDAPLPDTYPDGPIL